MAFAWRRRMRVWKLTGSGTRMLVWTGQTRSDCLDWLDTNGVTDGTYEITEVFIWSESGVEQ